MVRRYVKLECDHPGCDFFDEGFKISFLLDLGWCLSRDRKNCYCPIHADLHRHCGKMYSSVRGLSRFSSVVVTKSVTTTAPNTDDDYFFDRESLKNFDFDF